MNGWADRVSGAAALAASLAALLAAPRAHALSSGIVGQSGKQGSTCTSCHSGGAAPEVRFVGPDTVAPGATAIFTFEVRSMAAAQRAAGFNVAASAGTLAIVADQGERLVSGELTHLGPRLNGDMLSAFDIMWTAPDAPGTYTLFGAGNSVNLNGHPSGDRSSQTTLSVLVAESTATPTPTDTPLAPATATDTPTRTATPTRGTPAPTPTLGPCVGDCDGSGAVAVNELITGVNIALGSAAIGACADIDLNASGAVEINELVAAVNSALIGCRPLHQISP